MKDAIPVDFSLAITNWESFALQEKNKTKQQLNLPQSLVFNNEAFGSLQTNARDSMVFSMLSFKPEQFSEQELKQLFPVLTKYLAELWGGKVALLLPKEFINIFESMIDNASGFTLKPNANNIIYFSKEALITAFSRLENEDGYSKERKQRIKVQQQRFESGELRFLNKFQLSELKLDINVDELLYHFLADNAGFVYSDTNVDKLKMGLYSPAAMLQRRELDSVELFVAYDAMQQQIMHAAYVNIISDQNGKPQLAYISDIVARGPRDEAKASDLDQRNIGLSEVFFQQVYADIAKRYPELQGAFLIAGGNGLSPRGGHLNLEVFGGVNLNPNAQQLLSPPIMGDFAAFIRFFPTQGLLNGPLLVKAANRDPGVGETLDKIVWPQELEKKYAEDKKAAQLLHTSGQGNFAVPLPPVNNNAQPGVASPVLEFKK